MFNNISDIKLLDVTVTKRNLPHWIADHATYWVTFRLADSIPKSKLDAWRAEYALWLEKHPKPWDEAALSEYHERFGERLDKWLDAGMGSCALAHPEIREEARKSLLYFEGTRLTLCGAVIMPTHVHCVLKLLKGWQLPIILKSIKSASGFQANKILGKTGPFWQTESYDHIVRSEKQYEHFMRYIRENPLKAGLKEGAYWLYDKYAQTQQ